MSVQTSILVVDDNPSITKTMARVLEKLGYTVMSASDGAEALEVARKNQNIDVVFLDIKMPVMNGVETYKRIKSIIPEAVVVMMTAYAVDNLIQEAMREGAYGVVHKPVDFDRIVDLIQEAVANPKGGMILIIDDDPSFRTSFQRVLRDKGYQTVVCNSGEKAIELARENNFDVLFIDLKLPSINGLEAYLRIREVNPSAVAVIVTAYSDEMDGLVEQALRHSAYTCLQKPVNLEEVVQITRKIISRKRGNA